MAKLGDICTHQSSNIKQSDLENNNGSYPIYGASGLIKNVDFYKQEKPYVAIVKDGAGVGRVMQLPAYSSVIGTMQYIIPNSDTDVKYLAYAMEHMNLSKYYSGATIPHIYFKDYKNEYIKEHNTETQHKIANNLDKVTHTIDLCNAILEKLDLLVKSRFIEVFGSITKRRKLEEYADLITKGASPKWQGIDYAEEGTLFVTSENVREGYLDFTKKKYLPNDINKILPRSVLKRNDILINIVNASIGRVAVYDSDELANINQAVALVRLKPNALNITFLLTFLNSEEALRAYDFMKVGGDKANLSLKNISDLLIPVADLELQEKFATFVEQIDKSKLAVKQVLEKAETLKKALMQEYFGQEKL